MFDLKENEISEKSFLQFSFLSILDFPVSQVYSWDPTLPHPDVLSVQTHHRKRHSHSQLGGGITDDNTSEIV